MKANASSGIGHGRCPVSTDDRESTMSAFTPITAGNQIIRLAESDAEIEAAQRLRYRVFYEEMGAHPLPRTMAEKRDINEFDDACDHLVVLDLAQGGRPTVVGDGAVIDRQFNTTDVCIIVKTDLVTSRYAKHYELGDNKPMTQAPPSLRRQAS